MADTTLGDFQIMTWTKFHVPAEEHGTEAGRAWRDKMVGFMRRKKSQRKRGLSDNYAIWALLGGRKRKGSLRVPYSSRRGIGIYQTIMIPKRKQNS
jgi:hypothetical protein